MRPYNGVQERKLMVSCSSQFQNRNPGTESHSKQQHERNKVSDHFGSLHFRSEQTLNTSFADRSQKFANYYSLLYLEKGMEGNC